MEIKRIPRPSTYFTKEELLVKATEGKFKGTAPFQRWNESYTSRLREGCKIWMGYDKVTDDPNFYINEKKPVWPLEFSWRLHKDPIPGEFDKTHHGARFYNNCEIEEDEMCVNPLHIQAQRYQTWNEEKEIWETIR